METKICKRCQVEKSLDNFPKWSNRNSLRPHCRECINLNQKEYKLKNPAYYQKCIDRGIEKYWEKRNQELTELTKIIGFVRVCTKCGHQGSLEDFKFNRAKTKGSMNKTRLRGTCNTCATLRTKKWIEDNPEKMKTYYKRTYNRRKKDSEFVEKKKQTQKDKLQDPIFREKKRKRDRENRRNNPISIWRRLLTNSLKQLGGIREKNSRTVKLLGYTSTELFDWLGEKKNLTDHIDHSIPLSWMKSNTPANLACNLNNLSWLSEKQNLSKNSWYANPVSIDFFQDIKPYLKEEYQDRFQISDGMVMDNQKEIILEKWKNNESCL